MTPGDVNWLAIVLATLASMALGMAWYTVLSKQWMSAVGKSVEDIKQEGSATPFVWAALAQLVIAYFMAFLMPRIIGDTSIYSGLLTGAHMWVGFVITAMIINHRYQGQRWSLTFIDGGYLLGALLVQGVVIGAFG